MPSDRPLTGATSWPVLVAIGSAVIGLGFRLRVASLPIETLTSRYIADDYFYYLNVAFHIAQGRGSTFDGGVTVTNGYQPLFLWILVAVFKAGATKAAAVHIGLIVQAVAAAAASLAAFLLLARRGAPSAGALAAGLLNVNLFFVLKTLTGFEVALALACLLWAIWCWDSNQPSILVGLIAGLAVLARVDALVVVLVIAADLVRRRQTRGLLAFGGTTLVVTLPWTLWSVIQFGSPSPDSGLVKAHFRSVRSAAEALRLAVFELPRVAVPGRVVDALIPSLPVVVWTLAGVLMLITFWQALRTDNRGIALIALSVATAYAVLIGAGEPGALVRYLFPVWAIVVILAAQFRWIHAPLIVGLCLATHIVDQAIYVRWEQTAPIQSTYVGAAHQVARDVLGTLPLENGVVGSFDAGTLGYFAPGQVRVVNLDGLANHDIVELHRRCSRAYRDCMLEYLRSKGIRALAGGTAFGWTRDFPDWEKWERLYESPPLVDGSRVVLVRLP